VLTRYKISCYICITIKQKKASHKGGKLELRKEIKAMMKERKYFVANDNGEIAGHDMDYATAQECLASMIEQEPEAGWELLSDEE
jgi:hypothetical protein